MSHSLAEPMRKEFNDLLSHIGIWVVYTRSDHRFPCLSCYNLDTRDARADCEDCFGTGFKVQLERWLMYHSHSLRRDQPAQVPLGKAGFTNEMPAYFFSRHTEVPVAGDRIFLVEWNQPRDLVPARAAQPVRLVQPFRVLFAEPEIAGELIYYTAHCQFVTEAIDQYRSALARAPVKVTRG